MSNVMNRKVLLLAATYEPLGVISMARAVHLNAEGFTEGVELDGNRVVRSAKLKYPAPSVIRVKRYYDIRRKRRESGKQRFRIFVRDKFRCQYCCKKFAPAALTLDHIIPQSQGDRKS